MPRPVAYEVVSALSAAELREKLLRHEREHRAKPGRGRPAGHATGEVPWALAPPAGLGAVRRLRKERSDRFEESRMAPWVVRLRRGGPWDWSRGLREQDGWDDHAEFMDGLVDAGFILPGGPVEGDVDTVHVVVTDTEDAIATALRHTRGRRTAC